MNPLLCVQIMTLAFVSQILALQYVFIGVQILRYAFRFISTSKALNTCLPLLFTVINMSWHNIAVCTCNEIFLL